jgi:hypothetical protein
VWSDIYNSNRILLEAVFIHFLLLICSKIGQIFSHPQSQCEVLGQVLYKVLLMHKLNEDFEGKNIEACE